MSKRDSKAYRNKTSRMCCCNHTVMLLENDHLMTAKKFASRAYRNKTSRMCCCNLTVLLLLERGSS